MVCVRTAWLTLGAASLLLEDRSSGYVCTQLDLGYPTPRAVTANRPDADGAIDRTRLMGPRVVTADVLALVGAGAQIDAVATAFAPYMVPSARPQLHYVLDRPGAAERVLTLRASGYSWPIAGDQQRAVQLQWQASDPVARDPVTQSVTAYAGASGGPGRTYPLTFPRSYPTGTGAVTTATIRSPGDAAVRPLLTIWGPITGPVVSFTPTMPSRVVGGVKIALLASYTVAGPAGAGQPADRVVIDTAAHTVTLLHTVAGVTTATNALAAIDWTQTVWPVLPVLPDSTDMALAGASTTGSSQVVATWNDGYLM